MNTFLAGWESFKTQIYLEHIVGVSYKSGDSEEEIHQAKHAISLLGGKVKNVDKFQLPGTDMGRALVEIKKTKQTPGKYPRKAGLPAKEPLK